MTHLWCKTVWHIKNVYFLVQQTRLTVLLNTRLFLQLIVTGIISYPRTFIYFVRANIECHSRFQKNQEKEQRKGNVISQLIWFRLDWHQGNLIFLCNIALKKHSNFANGVNLCSSLCHYAECQPKITCTLKLAVLIFCWD